MHHAAVSRALQEMNSGYSREALQFLHGKDQGTVHHAVNQEPVLPGINVGESITVLNRIVERSRCDDSDRILQRSQISQSHEVQWPHTVRAHRVLVARTRTVCQILDGGLVRGNAPLGGGFATVDQTGGNAGERFAIRERDRSHGQASQSCTSLQKSSTVRLLGIHGGNLLGSLYSANVDARAVTQITMPCDAVHISRNPRIRTKSHSWRRISHGSFTNFGP